MGNPVIIYAVATVIGMTIGGIVGYNLGKTYRGQPVAGFWFGFFLGAIGWLLLIMVDDNRRKCPSCGLGVPDGQNTCPHCKTSMRPNKREPRPSKYEAKSYYCPQCGKKGVIRIVEAGTITVCQECDQRLDDNPRYSQPPSP